MADTAEIETFLCKVIGADVIRTIDCLNCRFRTDEQNSDGTVLKCSSCKVSMLKQNMPTHVNTNIIVTKATGEYVGRLVCPRKVLDSMFGS